jgi:hypothetical protein
MPGLVRHCRTPTSCTGPKPDKIDNRPNPALPPCSRPCRRAPGPAAVLPALYDAFDSLHVLRV